MAPCVRHQLESQGFLRFQRSTSAVPLQPPCFHYSLLEFKRSDSASKT
jgi:hypothetical protein